MKKLTRLIVAFRSALRVQAKTFRDLPVERRRQVFLIGGSVVAIVLVFVGGWIFKGGSSPEEKKTPPFEAHINPTKIDYNYRFLGSYGKTFDDLNDLHLSAAQQWGVDPDEIENLIDGKSERLCYVESTPTLKVASLSHSVPYLVPVAFDLIHDIATDFASLLEKKGLPPHRLIATSLTRTAQQRKALNKVNTNSSQNSAHCYGTTFDLSWSKYDPIGSQSVSDAILKKCLATILEQYRLAGRCYIKHERKQACFHITAIGCDEQLKQAANK